MSILTTSNRRSSTYDNSPSFHYPFTAIVGQEEMKLALTLCVIDPLIGGVLVMGHRGTGKSTTVRALADLLPQIRVVKDCLFGCDPKDDRGLCADCKARITTGQPLAQQLRSITVVDLPLGATEDRICGTIGIERALRDGVKTFEPGLLARANRGFLYIDEVNLLDDHLVDLLLDVAASGVNKVERESVSVEHPAHFVLIGSGNPEEGELRPQLLDRFGLHVEVKTDQDLQQRLTVVERREAFDRNPEDFNRLFESSQEDLRKRIVRARKRFAKIRVDRPLLRKIVQLCVDLKVDGHRGELTIMRAARALAALEGRKKATEDDVKRVAPMSLRHRLRRNAFEEIPSEERIQEALQEVFASQPSLNEAATSTNAGDESSQGHQELNPSHDNGLKRRPRPLSSPPAQGSTTKIQTKVESRRMARSTSNKSAGHLPRTSQSPDRGKHSQSVSFKRDDSPIAVAATLRAHLVSTTDPRARTPIHSDAFRYKLFTQKRGALFIFAIDASGSMATRRIAVAKQLMLTQLRQSYINRDQVAVIAFRGKSAEVVLPPTRSILRARRVIDSLPVGGSTPLAAGLSSALQLIEVSGQQYGEPVLLVFTDARANISINGSAVKREASHETLEGELKKLGNALRKTNVQVIVVDTQQEFESSSETKTLAKQLHAQFIKVNSSI